MDVPSQPQREPALPTPCPRGSSLESCPHSHGGMSFWHHQSPSFRHLVMTELTQKP